MSQIPHRIYHASRDCFNVAPTPSMYNDPPCSMITRALSLSLSHLDINAQSSAMIQRRLEE